MKKHLTFSFAALLLTAVALFTPRQASAQDESILGYTNLHFLVKAVPQDAGRVFPSVQQSGISVWRSEWDWKQSAPVSSMFGINFAAFFLNAKAMDDNYIFAGWYVDDGDGVFDIEKDEHVSDQTEYYCTVMLDDDAVVYDTQAAARNGAFPESPTQTFFALFTNGASVGMSYYQDESEPHANCGTVWISKTVNEPGDEVTIRAIPNEGYHFAYWQDANYLGNIVSTDNPYTFKVKGGERFYAYFMADNAPVFDLPEEGGFVVANVNATWCLSDESIKNGAAIVYVEEEDLTRTDDGKIYLDMSKDEAKNLYTPWREQPMLLYGKGRVTFSYKLTFGFSVGQLMKWSGKGTTVSNEMTYVYVFIPELGAFVQYGTTDEFNPTATAAVNIPANLCYFSMSAFDLTDDNGNIPTVIGLSPETFDKALAGYMEALDKLASIGNVKLRQTSLLGHKVYTLSGVEVKTTPEKGVYIVNGKKVVMK